MPRAGQGIGVARAEDGSVRIGGEPVGPAFTRAVLDVAGAVLTWPVPGADGLPAARVHDAGRAQQWLWALYGEGVAAAVHGAAAGEAAGEAAGLTVVAETTSLAGRAARLAFGHWAARWWPASSVDGIARLEPDLLGLESAALTHQCQELFDTGFGDQPDDCAAELITEHEAALDPLVRWWLAPFQPAGTARHLDGVLRLIDDAGDSAGLDSPRLRHLRASLDGPRPAGAPVDLGVLFARHREYALVAGEPLVAGGRLIARGSGTNAWHRCPPGFVDAAESAVTWTARAFGARRVIEVEAVADLAAPAAGVPLAAEVLVDGSRVARVPLVRRDDRWTGRAELDVDVEGDRTAAPDRQADRDRTADRDRDRDRGADPDRGAGVGPTPSAAPPHVDVGVLLPGFDPGPGDPGDAVRRDAVRALARRRLATAARPAPYDRYDTHDTSGAWPGPFLAEIAAAAGGEDF